MAASRKKVTGTPPAPASASDQPQDSRRPHGPAGDPELAEEADDEFAGDPVADDEFAGLGYEQARDALADVVRRLEGGAETLEESLALWERGEALARHCERWLAGARARLDAGQARADPQPGD